MDIHVRALGVLNILYAIVGAAGAIAAFVLTGGLREFYTSFDDPMIGAIATTVLAMHAATAIPSFIGGLFVRRFHNWARVLLTVTSALDTLTVPLGTLIGLYGLWVLLTPEVDPLFNDAPPPFVRGNSKPPGRGIMRADQRNADLGRATGD